MFQLGTASGRATCPICLKLVKKDRLDLTANLGTGHYYKVYHPSCFMDVYGHAVNNLSPYKKGYDLLMDYWDGLPDKYKPKLHKQLEALGL